MKNLLESRFQDIFDKRINRTIRIEHTPDGDVQNWLLDSCYLKLKIPNSTESFPWQYAYSELRTNNSKRLASGKWLLFRYCKTIVDDWKKICQEIGAGTLWSSKVSLTNRDETERKHLICVYTQNFYDVDQVRSVAILLNRLGLAAKTIYYKPDAFTHSGIYTDSGPASIYSFHSDSAGVPRL